MIPCEICDVAIPMHAYETHVQTCIFLGNFQRLTLGRDHEGPVDIQYILENAVPLWFPDIVVQGEREDDNEYEENLLLAERLGRVQVGLDASTLAEVTTPLTREQVKKEVSQDSDVYCPICMDTYKEILRRRKQGTTQILETTCHHTFCEKCVIRWFASSTRCPICNTDFSE